MNLPKLLYIFGVTILIISALSFWQRYNPQRLSFDVSSYEGTVNNRASAPTEILIPDISLNLPVIPAKINKNQWEATTKGVSYLSSSPVPGEKGNSILYGHNWPNLLGNIVKLKPGGLIKIKYGDGTVKEFIIDSTVIVSPKEVGILSPSERPQITLYTCTGFLDSKRFVVVARLKN